MDLKINIGTSLNVRSKTVMKDVIVRDLLMDENIPFKDGQVTLNGAVLGTSDLNKTLENLKVKDGDFLIAMSKHDNGVKPRT